MMYILCYRIVPTLHTKLLPISMETGFQPLILGHQRMIRGHYVVKGDNHDGLQVSCNSVHTIHLLLHHFAS